MLEGFINEWFIEAQCQPAQNAVRQAWREYPTDVAMRQPPDFRLLPLLPKLLDRLHIRAQIMDPFNQQYIFLRDDWRG